MKWPMVKLSQCCEIVSGSTPRRNMPEYWGGDIAWVTPKDLSNLDNKVLNDTPEKITAIGLKSCSAKLLPKGSLLFSSRAPIGHVAITGRPMATNQGFKSLVPSDDVNVDYLYWCIKHMTPIIVAKGRGATFKEVSKEIISNVEIPLPPLEEQKRIAAILDKADAIRKKRQRAIEMLDEFLRSAFLDMFGDPITNPKGWPNDTLGNLMKDAEVFTDGDWVESKDQDPEGDVRLTQLADIGDGEWLNKSARFLTAKKASELRCTFLRDGDVLVARMPDPLGRATVFPGDSMPCVTVVDVCILRPNPTRFHSTFLMHAINSIGTRWQIQRYATGTTRKRISRGNLSKVVIYCPPLAKQIEFGSFADKVAEVKKRLMRGLERNDDLFASLQTRAFRGEL